MSIQALNWAFQQTLPMSEKFALIEEAAQSWGQVDFTPLAATRRRKRGVRYVVGWPEAGVVKVGITRCGPGRWQGFIDRGADLIALHEFEDPVGPERHLLATLTMRYPRAFASSSDAEECLGQHGAGFTECFAVPRGHWQAVAALAEEGGG